MRLQQIRNIDSDILYVTKEINHGDWPFRFVVRVMFTEEWNEEWAKEVGPYHVEVLAVSPEAAKDKMQAALDSCGIEGEIPELGKYEVLVDYGTFATLWQQSGRNLSKLMREARQQLKQSDFLFGFAMDRQQNAVGASGWDFIAGEIFPR